MHSTPEMRMLRDNLGSRGGRGSGIRQVRDMRGGVKSRTHQCRGARFNFGLLLIHQGESGAALGEGARDDFARLTGAADAGDDDQLVAEIHEGSELMV